MTGFFRTYADHDPQIVADAAVVIPTLLRPQLRAALHSVFAQRFDGRIHILVGIDRPLGDPAMLDEICAARPPHCLVQAFWPGYSTARRHGGLTQAGDGGALRGILTWLANAAHVAYLDDDNWWDPAHLTQLRAACAQADWAFSLRWFVHPDSRRPICIDSWESVGPGAGMFNDRFGGYVDPGCLMINKLACPLAPHHWNFTIDRDDGAADRTVFAFLSRHHTSLGTGQATAFYVMNPQDGLHRMRRDLMGAAYDAAGTAAGEAAGDDSGHTGRLVP